jgi:hypothetical protein
MAATVFTIIILVAAFAVLFGVLLWRFGSYRFETAGVITAIVGVVIIVLAGATLHECGALIAGQGRALEAAQAYTNKHHPGGTASCLSRDTDNDKFITCTSTWRDTPNGPEQTESLRCGVDQWYYGLNVSGCTPIVPTRGALVPR